MCRRCCNPVSSPRQVAYPARAVAFSDLFVDSGSFPEGIYREPHAFESLDRSITSRILGLFASSAPSGAGVVSMWVPTVHPIHGVKWRHARLRRQLHSPRAGQSLFSTAAAVDQLHAVPFLTRHTHCLVFEDGWVAPFDPRDDGIFLRVVFAPESSPPAISALPAHCLHRPIFDVCSSVVVPLLGPLVSQHCVSFDGTPHVASGAIAPQVPTLSASELRAWRMMGFPFNRQWRWAYDATCDHGLTRVPTPVHMFTDLHILPRGYLRQCHRSSWRPCQMCLSRPFFRRCPLRCHPKRPILTLHRLWTQIILVFPISTCKTLTTPNQSIDRRLLHSFSHHRIRNHLMLHYTLPPMVMRPISVQTTAAQRAASFLEDTQGRAPT